MPNTGKITQIIGAVLDIKFTEGHLPSIYEAIHITRKNGELLVVEVAQHLSLIHISFRIWQAWT